MYDKLPIHTIHIINVKGNQFLKRFLEQSGIVNKKRAYIGNIVIHTLTLHQVRFDGKLNRSRTNNKIKVHIKTLQILNNFNINKFSVRSSSKKLQLSWYINF